MNSENVIQSIQAQAVMAVRHPTIVSFLTCMMSVVRALAIAPEGT